MSKDSVVEGGLGKLKKLTETLNNRDEHFKEMYLEFDRASESLHIVDKNATILWASNKEMESLGYEPSDYIGESIIDFHIDHEVIMEMFDILLSGGTLDNYPARMRAKDGSEKHFLINSSGFFKNGEFSHTRCFSRNVTGLYDLADKIKDNILRIKNKGL
jgi:two-component system, OmpR family, sensor histidine kinase VicK